MAVPKDGSTLFDNNSSVEVAVLPDPINPSGFEVEPCNEAQRVSVQLANGYERNTMLVKFTKFDGAVQPSSAFSRLRA